MTFVPATLLTDSLRVVASVVAPDPLVSVVEIAALRARLDTHLRQTLARQRVDYLSQPVFAPLFDDLTEFVCRPGKRLRPLLFLLAHRVFGAAPSTLDEGLLDVAVSLEMLHGFILIHDDIIDRAETRRGRPTLHRVIENRLPAFGDRRRAGRNLALVLGDILFALAQRRLLEAHLPPAVNVRLGSLLLGCMVETGFGEAADIIHGTRDVAKVSSSEIEQMYLLKTTRYTVECPLMMAAVCRGVDAGGMNALARIARPAGLAFQIQNDLQEFARFEVSDVEVPADILEGKKTLLMRAAFDRLGETDQGLLQLCFSACGPTEATVSKARELITRSGAVAELTARMHALFGAADHEINTSPFPSSVRQGLAKLIALVRDVAAG